MGVRLDLLLTDCLGAVAVAIGGPKAKMVWDAAGREIFQEKLKESGMPDRPVTAIEAARHVGILGPDPNVIEVKPNRKRRSRVSQD